MKIVMNLVIFFAIIINVIPAQAFLELRGTGSLALPNPKELNTTLLSNGIKQIYVFGAVGFDGIIKLPKTPFGLGVRYQYGGIKVDSAAGTTIPAAELQVSRTAALVDLRIVDSIFLFGFIGTMGLNHTVHLTTTSALGYNTDFSAPRTTSYSIGAETGIKAGPILAGGECGYQYFVTDSMSGPNGDAGFKIDLSGFYALAFLGLSF